MRHLAVNAQIGAACAFAGEIRSAGGVESFRCASCACSSKVRAAEPDPPAVMKCLGVISACRISAEKQVDPAGLVA